jgi:type VII secretion system ESX-1 substrate
VPVDVLVPVVGDPMAVSAAGRTLESIALDVANIAGRLRALATGDDSWTGAAAVAAHVRTASLPPTLDRANASYAAAGSALGAYARTLADAQDQSASAIAAAGRASAEMTVAVAAHSAAVARDAMASAVARSAGLPPPPLTAPRYEASIDEATAQLRRAVAANDDAHEQQRQAARTAAAALQHASHAGIHNQSWFHHVTHSVGHWASTHWTETLREVSKIGTVVSALAGAAALVLAVAGVAFPPLEAAAAALETVSLVSAVAAGMADTALAATGKASWTAVGVDALSLAPAGLGKLVTKAAPLIRESRLIKPSAIVHASDGTVFLKNGLKMGDHSIERLAIRSISVDEVESTTAMAPFRYYHEQTWKTGYYDPVNNLFVGTVRGKITTVIRPRNTNYINNLKAARP